MILLTFAPILKVAAGTASAGLVLWGAWKWLQRSDDPGALLFRWALSVGAIAVIFWGWRSAPDVSDVIGRIFAFMVTLVAGLMLAIIWTPSFCQAVAKPFASLYTGDDEGMPPQPFYSIALAKRKRGEPEQAIIEVQNQLAKFPSDFPGYMLLAEIYAEDLHDMDKCAEAIEQVLCQEGHLPQNVAYALTRLADWHLKLHNTSAALEALDRVVALLPDTDQAQMARQRIAHLSSPEREPKRLVIQQSDVRMGLVKDYTPWQPPPEDIAARAAAFVQQLEAHPFDNEAREELARLYADSYNDLALAIEQLEVLIATPHQLPKHVVHWLNMIADFQIKLASDVAAARAALQRIIDLYPNSAAAEAASSRISRLKLEWQGRQVRQTVKFPHTPPPDQ